MDQLQHSTEQGRLQSGRLRCCAFAFSQMARVNRQRNRWSETAGVLAHGAGVNPPR